MAKSFGVNIVVIGGGTGSFGLLSRLKDYTTNITALVNMVDDGGSTGVLRDELGVLPPGDVRQCLVALSSSPSVRDLFNYRFDDGPMGGHAFGNLFLSALEKMTGSFAEAVETASEVLNIVGHVYPMTLDNIKLVARLADGREICGEDNIGNTAFGKGNRPELSLDPVAKINPKARQAILEADLIVIAPGNLYRSLGPALIVNGVSESLKETSAKKVYVCNLVTKYGQTDDFMVDDFASEIERFMGVPLDYVLYNNYRPGNDLIKKYALKNEFLVEWDEEKLSKKHYKASGRRMIADKIWRNPNKNDPLKSTRSLIRHNFDRVSRELMRIYFA